MVAKNDPARKDREGYEEVLGKLRSAKMPARITGGHVVHGRRDELAFGYCIGGLRALYTIATTSQVPIGMRLEAAMKLADASMVLMKPRGRIPPKGSSPSVDPETVPDEGTDREFLEESEELPEVQSDGPVMPEEAEEIPAGWGEEPTPDQAPEAEADQKDQPVPGKETERAEAKPPRAKAGKTSDKILRQIRHYGPLTKSQVSNRVRGTGFLVPKDFHGALEYLCDKGHLERLQRGKRQTVYYGTPEQIQVAREHGGT